MRVPFHIQKRKAGKTMAVSPITIANFDEVISTSAKPVLVDFWATWCGPCRALGPVIERISDELGDKLDVYKCDVDENGDLAQRYGIMSIPTMILFKGGEPAHTMVGGYPEDALKTELLENL